MNMESTDVIKEIRNKDVPECGMMYAVYQSRVKYRAYNLEDIIGRENLADGLLELHLFNEHKEYRYIKKRKGFISKLIYDGADDIKYDDYYEEEIYTLDDNGQTGKVCVVNYITFDEDDLMQIENYRLKEVK